MAFTTRPGAFGSAPIRFDVTPWVKRLLMANAVVFLLTVAIGYETMFEWFAFSPGRLLERPWGVATYMFIHGGLWHLLMNLLVLFFFGPPLERKWGSQAFIKFYLVCGLGGVLLSFLFVGSQIVGASAAVYGIMMAFAMTWPEAPIYIWGVVPIKAKWLVGFLAALSFVSAVGPTRDGVAHFAHLGGVVTGFLFLKAGLVSQAGGAVPRPKRKNPFSTVTEIAGPEARQRRKDHKSAAKTAEDLDAVDRVLDKISARGIESLTAAERELLDRVSKKTRTN